MFLLFFRIIFDLTKSTWSHLSNFHIFNFKPKLYIRNPVRRFYNWTCYDRFNVTMNLFPMAYTLLFLVFKKSTTIILFFAKKNKPTSPSICFFRFRSVLTGFNLPPPYKKMLAWLAILNTYPQRSYWALTGFAL